MRIVRRDSLISTPWKNGGGETREIACFPPASSLTDFEWRISTAVVAQDGGFSVFDGIDRRLYLLEGNGMRLKVGSRRSSRLIKGDRIDFRGETPVYASLIDGPIVDLNIMVRREKQRSHIEELSISGTVDIPVPWEAAALFVRAGELNIHGAHETSRITPFDTLIFDKGHAGKVTVNGSADLILIGFDALKHLSPWDSQNSKELRLLRRAVLSQFFRPQVKGSRTMPSALTTH